MTQSIKAPNRTHLPSLKAQLQLLSPLPDSWATPPTPTRCHVARQLPAPALLYSKWWATDQCLKPICIWIIHFDLSTIPSTGSASHCFHSLPDGLQTLHRSLIENMSSTRVACGDLFRSRCCSACFRLGWIRNSSGLGSPRLFVAWRSFHLFSARSWIVSCRDLGAIFWICLRLSSTGNWIMSSDGSMAPVRFCYLGDFQWNWTSHLLSGSFDLKFLKSWNLWKHNHLELLLADFYFGRMSGFYFCCLVWILDFGPFSWLFCGHLQVLKILSLWMIVSKPIPWLPDSDLAKS